MKTGTVGCPLSEGTSQFNQPHGNLQRSYGEKVMKANVGYVDRIIRVIVGIALIATTLTGSIGLWGWIGAVPLVTGVVGSCPLYSALGINTCPAAKPR